MTGSSRSRAAWLAALAALTAWGALLRYCFLGEQSFWIDEAVSVTHARAILAHGYPLLPDGRVSWSSAPAHYLLALGILLGRDPHAGARFFPALAGTLSIPCLAWLVFLVFRRRAAALVAAALLTVLALEVAWSRQARAYAFVQLFELAGLALLLRFREEPRARDFWAGAALLLLAALCHPSAAWAFLAGAIACALPPRAVPARLAAVLPGRLWPLGLVLAAAALAAALQLSYQGEALHLLFAAPRGDSRYTAMYAGHLVVEFGLFFVLFWLGAVAALWRCAASAAGMLAASAVYAAFISLAVPLFAQRYLFPVLPVVIAFAALAATLPLAVSSAPRWRRAAGAALALLLVASGLAWARVSWLPSRETWLGYTEPQPDWRGGYAWIEEDFASRPRGRRPETRLTVVSAFPFLDAEYLRAASPRLLYLPASHTGLPDSVLWRSPYVRARPLGTPEELLRLRGAYLILDDLGLRMLADERTRAYLLDTPPDHTVPGPFPVYVWRLGA